MNRKKNIMNKNKKKKKRKMRNHQENTLFPLLLSSLLSKSQNNKPLIKKCLNKILLSLPHSLSTPILSLLPSLLKSNEADIVCRSAEIVGAAALMSFEMLEKVSSEDGIVESVVSMLGSSKRRVAVAACNAVLDLSTASIGRRRLIGFNAIEKLILCFIQAPKALAPVASTTADTVLLREDEHTLLLLQAAISLINSSTIDMLHHLPSKLSDPFLLYLKGLWPQAHKERFCYTSSACNKGKDFYVSINNLAESIFRLSIHDCPYPEAINLDVLEESIFALRDISLEKFLSTIWETSPMLVRDGSKDSQCQDCIFSPFLHYLGCKEAIPVHLPSILNSFISCPPLASDELDINHFFAETRNLGCPITYYQDIRVLKTDCSEREYHYFQGHIDDILRCREALKEGYSIAVRGMEFRFPALAAMAAGIASFFGQPSVGVNMYLTPPNSQGLARHSDDHCVFVCQLMGSKKWTIYPRSNMQLPRLYESFDGSYDFEGDGQASDGCQQILLKEGDVLYIPRGFPHEARTYVDDDELEETAGFSLHLTLAVEIEPPFEWEGFIQIAVCSWLEKNKSLIYNSGESIQWTLNVLSVKLLHIVIKLNADLDSTFRKACLVGAGPILSSVTGDWFCKNQRTIFHNLINRVAHESKFSDAVRYVEATLQNNEDPLEHVRWMKHLTVEGELKTFYDSTSDNRYLFDLQIQDRNIAVDTFMQIKLKFCQEVAFQDVEQHYILLLEKYRKVRKQYTNGMLSLHCTTDREHVITS